MRYSLFIFFAVVITSLVGGVVFPVSAQDGNRLSLAVTPPLFQLTVDPGQVWSSSVKMVNSNPYEITVYATPVNFEARGEDGSARFIPLVDDARGENSPAGWLQVARGPYVIPAESSADIPFNVMVPESAPPGGHYAALLIGTEPIDESVEGPTVRVSSLVTSLMLMRVEGEVVEEGSIREFRTDAGWYERPEARFVLRFQNSGNVHLRPRGVIEIENMWGQSRGSIPINTGNEFGNVLPDSTRTFSFRWSGEQSLFESGKYRAVVTLAYGGGGQRHVSEEITFWVIPFVPLLIILSIVITVIATLFISIRLYVRRVLSYEKRRYGLGEQSERPVRRVVSAQALGAPIREGVIDMKRSFRSRESEGRASLLWTLIKRYRYFVLSIISMIILVVLIVLFALSGFTESRSFQIFEERPGGSEQLLP